MPHYKFLYCSRFIALIERNKGKMLMASESIISWNVTNWITVILMAAVGFALLGLAQKAISKKVSGANAAS
jgi:hypothetical protein